MTITVSDGARKILTEINETTEGHLRLSVNTKGCAGLVYEFKQVDQVNPNDEEVKVGPFSLYLDSDRIIYLLGTHIDHVDDIEGRRFVFSNKAFNTCGCGHSFRVGSSG